MPRSQFERDEREESPPERAKKPGLPQEKSTEFRDRLKNLFKSKYYKKLVEAANEDQHFILDYAVLDRFGPDLGDLLIALPETFFELAEAALDEMELPGKVKLRVNNLPEVVMIRDLRSKHIGKFICTEGIIRRASEIRPEVVSIIWECPACNAHIEVERRGTFIAKPFECPECGNKRSFKEYEKKLVDTRWVVIEEPFEMTEGERPSQVTILLTGDMLDDDGRRNTEAGNRLKICGILRDVPRGKLFSVKLDFYMEANYFEPTELGWEKIKISNEDEKKIKEVANDPHAYELLVGSLAPSLYGLNEIKEAIILQLFGGVQRDLKDGTHTRGDIHLLLIGDPAAGKCVTGDTNVVMSTGEIKPIKNLVEAKMQDEKKRINDGWYATGNDDVLSLSLDGFVDKNRADIFWKRESPDSLYRIETRAGRSINVTPTHPFFVPKDGFVVSKMAQQLKMNDFIAVPRRLGISGKQQLIDIRLERSKSRNANHINVPRKMSKKLSKFFAYVLAEGYVQRTKSSDYVWFTNNDPDLIRDFEDACSMFGVPLHKRGPHKGKNARDAYLSSIELGRFLENIDPSFFFKSSRKRIPDIVMRSTNDDVSAFLRVFFDCEAHVRTKGIELTTASKEMSEQIFALLLRFGILSQIHPMKKRATNSRHPVFRDYYRVLITGKNIETYRHYIGFLSERKRKTLDEIGRKETTTDVFPGLSAALKSCREKLKMTQFDMGIPRTTYQHFERGDRNPTSETLLTIIGSLENRLKQLADIRNIGIMQQNEICKHRESLGLSQNDVAELAGISQTLISQYELCALKPTPATLVKIKKALKGFCESLLADDGLMSTMHAIRQIENSSIMWDRIKKIEKLKSTEKWVYDLQVSGVHNFVANGMFVHNSQLLKLVPEIVPRGKYVSGKGVTGAGLCTTYDSLIQLKNGNIMKIGDLVERELKNNAKEVSPGVFVSAKPKKIKLASLDKKLKIAPLNITQFWKIKAPRKLLELDTKTGRKITVTTDNPILAMSDGRPVWKKACEVNENEFVACARTLFESKQQPTTLELLDGSSHVLNASNLVGFIANEAKHNGRIRDLAKRTNIDENKLYRFWRDATNVGKPTISHLRTLCDELDVSLVDMLPDQLTLSRSNGRIINLPKDFNEDLMYLVGLIAGDGSVSRTGFGGFDIKFSNKDGELLKMYSDICSEQIGIVPRYEKSAERIPNLRFSSKIFAGLLDGLGVPSGKKSHKIQVTEYLSSLPNNLISSYLQGLFDTDGCVVSRKSRGNNQVELDSASEKFIHGVQLLLLKFGILSTVRRRNPTVSSIKGRPVISGFKWSLEIRDLKNLSLFSDRIGFRFSEKQKKLVNAIKKIGKSNTNNDVIPGVGGIVKKLREDAGMSAKDVYGYKCYSYEKSRRNFSRDSLEKALREINVKTKESEFLGNLCNSDIFWDRVKRKKIIENKEHDFVYDVTIDGEHSFICNGVVIHNTATVTKDEQLGGWVLEAGAMVLANKGLLSVDEFEKMSQDDQVAMHEALEQGSVSIAKASIVATLPAKTSVLAGGNPKFSRFDPYMPIAKQINIPDSLLSRFDLKFALRDIPDTKLDTKIVQHILSSREDDYLEALPKLGAGFIRKYITYAKRYCFPVLPKETGQMMKKFYVDTRKRAQKDGGAIPITLRQFEALVRLAEASAKIQLSPTVRKKDAERAIRLMKFSLEQLGLVSETGEIDIDKFEGASTTSKDRSSIRVVLDIINELSKTKKEILSNDIIEEAKKQDVNDADDVIERLKREGMLFEPSPGYIQKV